MHSTVLVGCYPSGNNPTYEDIVEAAEEVMEEYRGHYDYYSTSLRRLSSAFVSKDGTITQYCRARDFNRFDECPPSYIVSSTYIDRYLMEKYGVDWNTVVEKEIAAMQDWDSDEEPVFFFLMDVHI